MKHGRDKQKNYHDRQSTIEVPRLRSGDHARVKPEPRLKERRAATVVQKHAIVQKYVLPRPYVVEVGEQRLNQAQSSDYEKRLHKVL